jgi:CRP-like cAMP-binding protein
MVVGVVDLSEAIDIIESHMENEDVPSEYPINIVTASRVWILYAENKIQQDEWSGRFRNVITGAYDAIAYANLSNHSRSELLSDIAPPSSLHRSNSTELLFMQQQTKSRNMSPASQRNRKSSIFYRAPSHSDLPTSGINITEQSRRVASLKSTSSSSSFITGNLPMLSLSVFSQINIDDMDYFELLKSYVCSNNFPSQASIHNELHKRIFDWAIFDFSQKEGDILIHEGSKFEWIYFILKGEVSRRKGWGGDALKVIADTLCSGQCIGDVECLLLDSISPFTLIIGPSTTLLKLRKEIFLRECSVRTTGSRHQSIDQRRDPTREGIFSTKYLENLENQSFNARYKFFSSQLISCHGLFEKQSKGNINEISKLFKPVFMKAGEVIIDETSSSTDELPPEKSSADFEFFLLIEGTCSVFKKDVLGVEQCVHSIRSGDWIGETGFSKQKKNETKVCATVDSILLKTDALGFQRFLDIGGPNVRHSVERSVTNHMASTIKNIPVFHDLEENLIENICVVMTLKEFSPNTVVVKSGHSLNYFCVIIHGKVEGTLDQSGDLTFSSPPIIDTMHENDFFGESWILLSTYLTEATYTVSSSSKVVVLSAPLQDFKPIVESSPVLRLRLEERFQSRKSRMEMTHTLASVIAQSLRATMSPVGNQMKLSMDSTSVSGSNLSNMGYSSREVNEFESINSELQYLRSEVERLGGVKYQRPLGKKALRQLEEESKVTSPNSPNPSRRTSLKHLFSSRERSKSPSRSNGTPPVTATVTAATAAAASDPQDQRGRSRTPDPREGLRGTPEKRRFVISFAFSNLFVSLNLS